MPPTFQVSGKQIRIGAWPAITPAATALFTRWAMPTSLEEPLGLRADPWRRPATALSGMLLAATRTLATLRGRRRGPPGLLAILSGLLLPIGGFARARQGGHEPLPGAKQSKDPAL